MIDFRFHIFSMVAMFLALGIGIIIGITMVGDDVLVNEQKALIDRLEQEFSMLREQNRLTQKEINVFKNTTENYVKFAQSVLPLLVKDKLAGQNIAIITTSGYVVTDSLSYSLKLAGANEPLLIRINNSFNFNDPDIRLMLISNLGLKPARNSNELAAEVSQSIAQNVSDGFDPAVASFLEDIGLISMEGLSSIPPDAVVIIGGSQESRAGMVNVIDLPMIDCFSRSGLKVAATEYSQVPYSCMGMYQNKKVITIDNIDTVVGQVALIMALNDMPGNYGIKPTADSLLPSVNEITVGSERSGEAKIQQQ